MPQDLRVPSAASPHGEGAEHGGARSNALTPLPCLDSGSYKGSRRTSCPHSGLFWGNFPTVLESSRGGGAARWPGCYLVAGTGWHRSRRHAPRWPFLGCIQCLRARLHPGPGTGMGGSLEGGGAGCPCKRAEHGHNPTALAVSSRPSTVAPVVLIEPRGTLISVFPVAKVSAFILSILYLK